MAINPIKYKNHIDSTISNPDQNDIKNMKMRMMMVMMMMMILAKQGGLVVKEISQPIRDGLLVAANSRRVLAQLSPLFAS